MLTFAHYNRVPCNRIHALHVLIHLQEGSSRGVWSYSFIGAVWHLLFLLPCMFICLRLNTGLTVLLAKYMLGFKSLQRNITSIYATTILRDFLNPSEALRQPSPHASPTQISNVGLPNVSSLPLNNSLTQEMLAIPYIWSLPHSCAYQKFEEAY